MIVSVSEHEHCLVAHQGSDKLGRFRGARIVVLFEVHGVSLPPVQSDVTQRAEAMRHQSLDSPADQILPNPEGALNQPDVLVMRHKVPVVSVLREHARLGVPWSFPVDEVRVVRTRQPPNGLHPGIQDGIEDLPRGQRVGVERSGNDAPEALLVEVIKHVELSDLPVLHKFEPHVCIGVRRDVRDSVEPARLVRKADRGLP
mmetsp:Transcript_129427/g.360510  ORF Transcript_129427/g.360510 Transcript_129427/m.360510 type:complete len:201 (-) Transcript_129427:361-963(-)